MTKKAGRQPTQPTRKQLSRREKEERKSRLLIIGVSSVLALAVLLLVWGLIDQYVLRPRTPVATVAGVPIDLATYQKHVQYRRWDYQNYLNRLESQKLQLGASEENDFFLQYIDQQISQVQAEMMSLPSTVVDELIDDLLIRQECASRGITVAPEEVDIMLEEQFGYERNPPTPTPTPITPTLPITVTPTPTVEPMSYARYQELTQSWFQAMRENTRFTEQEFRRLLETSLYREKLVEVLGAGVPTTTEQLRASHILVETREEAESVKQRLEAGEAFEDLAIELSMDSGSGPQGGDLGWFGLGDMVPEFEAAALALQPGEISDIVESQYGFHIIRLDERDPHRPLDENELAQARQQVFTDWLDERRRSEDVVRKWDSTMAPTPLPTRLPQRR